MTFLSNPATTPFILVASIYIGNSALNMGADVTQFEALIERNAPLSAWADWLVSSAAPAMLTGLFLIALLSAVIGYVIAAVSWRIWLSRKWKARAHRRRAA
jgi:uncharacterized protein (DUF2062 family)